MAEKPTIKVFVGKTDFFGKGLEQEITIDPENLWPFERTGYYGSCMSCDADLHKGDWYEIIPERGKRYYCDKCIAAALAPTPKAAE